MPPRKSNTSQVPTTGDEATPSKERDGVNIEDLSLPRTMVQRLAKGVLAPNTQIQKDAITAMSKAATVFVNYLSQAANTSTIPTARKTISPEAVLDALSELEFEDFIPRVQAELRRFNEVQTGKRNEYRRKLKEKETAENGSGGGVGARVVQNGHAEADGERAAKRLRRDTDPQSTNGVSSSEAAKGAVTEAEEEEEEEEDEEEQADEVEAGKEATPGEEAVDEGDTQDEEDEDSVDERRATDLDEADDADLEERAGDEEDEDEEEEEEERSSEDSE